MSYARNGLTVPAFAHLLNWNLFAIRHGGALTLNWANYGTLLGATNLAGPWVPVTGAVSPYMVGATNAATFYRVQIH